MLFPSFKKFVVENDLIRVGDGVVVAVSGGCDSTVLLDLLCRLSKSMEPILSVAHVNYGLRGRASDADEALVRKTCSERSLAFDVIRKRPQADKNLQEAARLIRYSFFDSVARKRGARVVATAHHAGDQAETILLHMIRGSGLAGLAGMRPAAPLGEFKLVRPLLFAARDDIKRHAEKHRIAYREDATNSSPKYTRNTLRHSVIPLLQEMNPRIVENLATMGERLLADDEALRIVAQEAMDQASIRIGSGGVSWDRLSYAGLPAAIRIRALRLAFEKLSGGTKDLNADQVKRMDGIALGDRREASYRLPSPWKFNREGDLLMISRSVSKCDRSR